MTLHSDFTYLHGGFKILTRDSSTSTLANITFWYCSDIAFKIKESKFLISLVLILNHTLEVSFGKSKKWTERLFKRAKHHSVISLLPRTWNTQVKRQTMSRSRVEQGSKEPNQRLVSKLEKDTSKEIMKCMWWVWTYPGVSSFSLGASPSSEVIKVQISEPNTQTLPLPSLLARLFGRWWCWCCWW